MIEDWEGKLPKESNEEYHKREELSSSDIKWADQSMAHFEHNVLNKHKIKKKSSDSFDLGSCVHEVFLCGDTSQFVTLPADAPDRPTKAQLKAKVKSDNALEKIAFWERFDSENKGKRIITAEQCERVCKMSDALFNSKLVMSLYDGMKEQGHLYKDPNLGIHCKYRGDIDNPSGYYMADLKSCESAKERIFKKAIARYGYHISAAHYLVGGNRLYNNCYEEYFFIAIENKEPYAIAVYRMSKSDILKATDKRNMLMEKIKKHYDEKKWPDWSEEIKTIEIPMYAFS